MTSGDFGSTGARPALGRAGPLGRPRPRLADGKLLRAPNVSALVHEMIPPLERGGAGPAGQPYPALFGRWWKNTGLV